MASLREVKRRIVSVEGTQKITVARQMIASALLHKTQDMLTKAEAYKQAIDDLYGKLANGDDKASLLKQQKAKQGKTGVVLISSNSGMCGSFNINIIKEIDHLAARYPGEELVYYPIGRKVRESLLHHEVKLGFENDTNWDHLVDKPTLEMTTEAAHYLEELYTSGSLKQVIIVHAHFRTVASQEVVHSLFLPYQVNTVAEKRQTYIIEPSAEKVREALLEKSLKAAFYATIVDSLTAEHAARTLAMQLASENANELLTELNIVYNKVRQQNITSELLDIVGNSFA